MSEPHKRLCDIYYEVFKPPGAKPESLKSMGAQLKNHPAIKALIKEYQDMAAEACSVTVASLLAELEEARQLALTTEKAAPAVAATMGKAKLCGLDKQIIDHTSSDGSMSPRTLEDFYAKPDVKPEP